MRGGREVESIQGTVEVGSEYVVLGIWAQAEGGTSYSSEMFEIISATIPSSWVVSDIYGGGRLIAFEPAAWTTPPGATESFFERKLNGDRAALETFIREVERMYAEEGREPPSRTSS
jgi:hypothetical protein